MALIREKRFTCLKARAMDTAPLINPAHHIMICTILGQCNSHNTMLKNSGTHEEIPTCCLNEIIEGDDDLSSRLMK